MFIEYNWTACTYFCRFGETPTDFRGVWRFDTIQEWRDYLAPLGCNLRKVDSRTWEVYTIENPA